MNAKRRVKQGASKRERLGRKAMVLLAELVHGAVVPGGDKAGAMHLTELGLAMYTADGMLSITDAGRAHLERRIQADRDASQSEAIADAPMTSPRRNAEENPLDWLRRRQKAAGRGIISEAGFEAGDRLRADFTLGQLTPSITMNWSGAIARDPGGGYRADLGDIAIAARQRWARALDAVGSEFAGLLLDVCCFLKGLEAVESERGWPLRSAKVVLGLGLERLARHYGLSSAARGPSRSRGIRQWGDADYRPVVDGL